MPAAVSRAIGGALPGVSHGGPPVGHAGATSAATQRRFGATTRWKPGLFPAFDTPARFLVVREDVTAREIPKRGLTELGSDRLTPGGVSSWRRA